MVIDPRLEGDSFEVAHLDLCQVRLHKNAAFPWLILIPNRPGITEIIDLGPSDQVLLMREIDQTSRVLKSLTSAHKINVASLGNVVPQLHIHVVARYNTDPLWPDPIWGRGVHKDYDSNELHHFLSALKSHFQSS